MKLLNTILLSLLFCYESLGIETNQTNIVYSSQIVGYVVHINPPGYRLISNPFNKTNNDVSFLFINPPNGLTISKRNSNNTGYNSSTFNLDIPGWSEKLILNPGEAAFLNNPTTNNYTNIFVGQVILNSTNLIQTNYSTVSCIFPQSGRIKTDLEFPIEFGDTIFKSVKNGYNSSTYDEDIPGWTEGEPIIKVGEGFWIYNSKNAKNWIRNFSVN